MFACILNTNPVIAFSLASTKRSSAFLDRGVGAIWIKQSNNSRTPKLLRADPKKTGCWSPFRYSSLLNFGYTPHTNSRLSLNSDAALLPIILSSSGFVTSSKAIVSSIFFLLSPLKRLIFFSKML